MTCKNNYFRSVVLTRHKPFPPIGGAPLRNWQNINLLARFSEVYVISITPKVEVDTGGTSHYLWSHISLRPDNLIRKLERSIRNRYWRLIARGHPNAKYSRNADHEFKLLIDEVEPALIVIEELWLYPYLEETKSWKVKTVYDAHNVEANMRKEIGLAEESSRSKSKNRFLTDRVKKAENWLVQNTDQVWTCSEKDGRTIKKLYGSHIDVSTLPNTIDPGFYQESKGGNRDVIREEKQSTLTIVYPAAFEYGPNQVAADLLTNEVFPLVKSLDPGANLVLVGRSPTASMLDAATRFKDIEVTGEVPDVRPYLSTADVMIVPLMQGGGTRLKILEAFASHTPVVSTTKGAEGLDIVHGRHLLIADTAEEIARRTIELRDSPGLANELADSAYKLLLEKYSWNAIEGKMIASLTKLGFAVQQSDE